MIDPKRSGHQENHQSIDNPHRKIQVESPLHRKLVDLLQKRMSTQIGRRKRSRSLRKNKRKNKLRMKLRVAKRKLRVQELWQPP